MLLAELATLPLGCHPAFLSSLLTTWLSQSPPSSFLIIRFANVVVQMFYLPPQPLCSLPVISLIYTKLSLVSEAQCLCLAMRTPSLPVSSLLSPCSLCDPEIDQRCHHWGDGGLSSSRQTPWLEICSWFVSAADLTCRGWLLKSCITAAGNHFEKFSEKGISLNFSFGTFTLYWNYSIHYLYIYIYLLQDYILFGTFC